MVKNHGALALIAILILATAGCAALLEAQETSEAPDVTPDPPSDDAEVILYFADHQAQHVVPELRRVRRVGDEPLARTVVRELITGPEDPHLFHALPADTAIISAEIVEDIVYVNLSEHMKQIYGSAGEMMAVGSLVYSLTELADVQRVQILIEGRKTETLSGHVYVQEPLDRGEVLTHPIFLDEDRAAWLQEQADLGEQVFRTDPLEVARFDGRMVGLTGSEHYHLMEVDEQAGTAHVLVERDNEQYLLELGQPADGGEGGIWMIRSVTQVYDIDITMEPGTEPLMVSVDEMTDGILLVGPNSPDLQPAPEEIVAFLQERASTHGWSNYQLVLSHLLTPLDNYAHYLVFTEYEDDGQPRMEAGIIGIYLSGSRAGTVGYRADTYSPGLRSFAHRDEPVQIGSLIHKIKYTPGGMYDILFGAVTDPDVHRVDLRFAYGPHLGDKIRHERGESPLGRFSWQLDADECPYFLLVLTETHSWESAPVRGFPYGDIMLTNWNAFDDSGEEISAWAHGLWAD